MKQTFVYRIAWDGEPSMSGRPHVCSQGEFDSVAMAQAARDRVPGFRGRPNLRIQRRLVTAWQDTDA